jgi:hypothetical protein
MLYSEIIAVCSEIHTKHINTLFGQNVEFVNVKRGGTYSNKECFVIEIYVLPAHVTGVGAGRYQIGANYHTRNLTYALSVTQNF